MDDNGHVHEIEIESSTQADRWFLQFRDRYDHSEGERD